MSAFRKIRIMKASLESEDLTGAVQIEDEAVWYVKGINVAQVQALAVKSELQEQYGIPAVNGTARVRRIDGGRCIQTCKSWVPGQPGRKESEIEVPADLFGIFSQISPNGMVKRRYRIPIFGSDDPRAANLESIPEFEVDLYFVDHVPDGTIAPWCKIDYEGDRNLLKGLEWPFDYEEIHLDIAHRRTPEQQQFISELMDKYLIKKNGA